MLYNMTLSNNLFSTSTVNCNQTFVYDWNIANMSLNLRIQSIYQSWEWQNLYQSTPLQMVVNMKWLNFK